MGSTTKSSRSYDRLCPAMTSDPQLITTSPS